MELGVQSTIPLCRGVAGGTSRIQALRIRMAFSLPSSSSSILYTLLRNEEESNVPVKRELRRDP